MHKIRDEYPIKGFKLTPTFLLHIPVENNPKLGIYTNKSKTTSTYKVLVSNNKQNITSSFILLAYNVQGT